MSLPTKSRDWKGIFISLLVILSVVGLVFISIQIVTPPPGPPRLPQNIVSKNILEIHENILVRVKGKRMEYDQISQGAFEPNNHLAEWVSGKMLKMF